MIIKGIIHFGIFTFHTFNIRSLITSEVLLIKDATSNSFLINYIVIYIKLSFYQDYLCFSNEFHLLNSNKFIFFNCFLILRAVFTYIDLIVFNFFITNNYLIRYFCICASRILYPIFHYGHQFLHVHLVILIHLVNF